jgi:hypothetical protein
MAADNELIWMNPTGTLFAEVNARTHCVSVYTTEKPMPLGCEDPVTCSGEFLGRHAAGGLDLLTEVKKLGPFSVHAINAIRSQRGVVKWIPKPKSMFGHPMLAMITDFDKDRDVVLHGAKEYIFRGPHKGDNDVNADINEDAFEFVKAFEFNRANKWPRIVYDLENDTETMEEARAAWAKTTERPLANSRLEFAIETARAEVLAAKKKLRQLIKHASTSSASSSLLRDYDNDDDDDATANGEADYGADYDADYGEADYGVAAGGGGADYDADYDGAAGGGGGARLDAGGRKRKTREP